MEVYPPICWYALYLNELLGLGVRWLFFLLACLGLMNACSTGGGEAVIATYDGGEITSAELNSYLEYRSIPEDKAALEPWLKARLAELFQIETKVTEEELLYLRTHASFQKQIEKSTQKRLADAYLNLVMPNFIVDAHDIDTFMEKKIPQGLKEERRAVQNIFLRFLPNSDAAAKAEIRAKAEDLRKQLVEGAAFEALAKAHSHSATAVRGGFFGLVGRDDLREPLASVVFALKPGEVSEVVVNESGCHIFYLKRVANQLKRRRKLAEVRMRANMKKDWTQTHLMELLIAKNLPISRWPQEPAGESGLLFTYADQRLTVADVRRMSPNKSAYRDTFLRRVGELIFAGELRQMDATRADAIAKQAEQQEAFKFLRRESLLAEI